MPFPEYYYDSGFPIAGNFTDLASLQGAGFDLSGSGTYSFGSDASGNYLLRTNATALEIRTTDTTITDALVTVRYYSAQANNQGVFALLHREKGASTLFGLSGVITTSSVETGGTISSNPGASYPSPLVAGEYNLKMMVVDRMFFFRHWAVTDSEPTTWLYALLGDGTATNIQTMMGFFGVRTAFSGIKVYALSVQKLTKKPEYALEGFVNGIELTERPGTTCPLLMVYKNSGNQTTGNADTSIAAITDHLGDPARAMYLHRATAVDGIAAPGFEAMTYNRNVDGPPSWSTALAPKRFPAVEWGPYQRYSVWSYATDMRSQGQPAEMGLCFVCYYDSISASGVNGTQSDYYHKLGPPRNGGRGTWALYNNVFPIMWKHWDIFYRGAQDVLLHNTDTTGAGYAYVTSTPYYPVEVSSDGLTVTIDYGYMATDLSPASAITGFTVNVNGTPATISAATSRQTSVTVGGTAVGKQFVDLTVSSAIEFDDVVTVEYEKVLGNLVNSEGSPRALPGFTAQDARNLSQVGAPNLTAPATPTAPTVYQAMYSRLIAETAAVANALEYEWYLDSETVPCRVTTEPVLDYQGPITNASHTLKVLAVSSVNNVKGTASSTTTFTQAGSDALAPKVYSRTTNASGVKVIVESYEPIDYITAQASDWAVKVNGVSRSVIAVALATQFTVELTLSANVITTDTVLVSYSGSGVNAVKDRSYAKNQMATFTDQAVTNSSTATESVPTSLTRLLSLGMGMGIGW